MYYTDNNDRDGYCLLYYPSINFSDEFHQSLKYRPHQIIPYCLRSSEDSLSIAQVNSDIIIKSTISFADLYKQNISSDMLISWSAPIDLAERYQMFLSNVSNSSSWANTLFYNCTYPWFGPRCQFAFDLTDDVTVIPALHELIYWNLFAHHMMWDRIKVTCYEHLQCETWLICLDWREICNGKFDCFDGSDEFNCWQLEMNECNENEYRCYNGQCIPKNFHLDYILDPDCLDRTDEYKTNNYPKFCSFDPTFRCEEHKCHPESIDFSCGNGKCEEETEVCFKSRNNVSNNDLCSNAMRCIFRIVFRHDYRWCDEYCTNITCIEVYCPPFYEFPPGPIFFGHVRFIFSRDEVVLYDMFSRPKYVCYDEKLCGDFLPAKELVNDSTCRYFHDLEIDETKFDTVFGEQIQLIKEHFHTCLTMSNEEHYLNQKMMYQCQNSSKYISKYRLLDLTKDCPFGDDETYNNESCLLNDAKYRYKCSIDNNDICFAPFIPTFERLDQYKYGCDSFRQFHDAIETKQNEIDFQMICDGLNDLLPIVIDGQNETDETGCEHWICNNTYTRCNKFWTCPNGADEVNCPLSICPEFYHDCVFFNDTKHISCLHMNYSGDGIVHCLGATDEPNQCLEIYPIFFAYNFRCRNDAKCLFMREFCNGHEKCQLGDDELFCNNNTEDYKCFSDNNKTDVESFLCNFGIPGDRSKFISFFTVRDIPTYALQFNSTKNLSMLTYETRVITNQNTRIVNDVNDDDVLPCNRGLPIYIRTNTDVHTLSCLCPPSYYGNKCQYQNQRISLTLQIRATSDWNTLFTFLIFLIDDHETNIESHDYIEYLPSRDCDIKFNVYLLYLTRPKNSSKNYSVRIDAYNRMKMTYRASWIFPLQFPFLPIHRLPVHLIIPFVDVQPLLQCSFPCIHGQCYSFVNDRNSSFCRCYPGWTGVQCDRMYLCDCEFTKQCIDESICLCPIGRYGRRCYLFQTSCHSTNCANNGQCIPDDERYIDLHQNRSTCICPSEYIGDQCEYERKSQQTQIDISFDDSLIIPSSLIIHLIQIHENAAPNRTSLIKKIRFDQTSLTFYTSIMFHLAFAKMFNNYYLIILQEQEILHSYISTKIIPSHRCASINELFNKTIIEQELLRRIKLYHIPCQKQHELVCFYDSIHLCLCDNYHRANCFRFNHDITHNCDGANSCENEGQCFLDQNTCPKLSICACSRCSFGSRCQFSTEGSTLLLDIILGYRFTPHVAITKQSNIIKFSIALTIILLVLGLINNICTYLTFQMRKTRDVGCGIYLFSSSIIGLITMCILTVKFWLLLASQTGSIKNRLFIQIQCITLDFVLRILLSSGEWVRVCVSIERTMAVLQGTYFNKMKSKKIAKWMLVVILIFTICTHIHDPIYRRLYDDEEEQRFWCITKFSSSLRTFDKFVNIIHFFIPFIINFISALLIIINATGKRSNAQKNLPYKHILREQLKEHKHLLISPIILILLEIPYLVISFLSGCMKSTRDSWFYLIGYYIAFIPSMLTFIIFVLPSKLYKTEFKKSVKSFVSRLIHP